MSQTLRIRDYSLRELNSWGCGGRCLWFAAPTSVDEAAGLIRSSANDGTPLFVLGGGSNVLVQEGQIEAGVISSSNLADVTAEAGDGCVYVRIGAGFSVKALLALSFANGWGGTEFLTGIPGTVGGALFGNAGADGRSFAPSVESITAVTEDGEVRKWERGEFEWRYRNSPWKRPPLFITGASFCFPLEDKQNIIKNIRHFAKLKKGQPIGAMTAGCVFKNPVGNAAGALLDSCGCKELFVGEARVCPSHANFIENRGEAKADDIFKLTELCRARVFDRYGIRLEYEIKIIGEFSAL